MPAKILEFKIKYISAVACCEHCAATWIAHMKEIQYRRYMEGMKKVCPHCGSYSVYFCRTKL